jgi:anti-anti-sigma factor
MSTKTLYPQVTTFQAQRYVSAANATEFLEELTIAVTAEKDSALLVDMKEVEFIDSAGLVALVKGFRLAQSLDRRFSLCSVSPSLRMIFEITQLDEVFEIFEDRDTFEAALTIN